jgi:hypothetical protein
MNIGYNEYNFGQIGHYITQIKSVIKNRNAVQSSIICYINCISKQLCIVKLRLIVVNMFGNTGHSKQFIS